jgi:hypothetical protein
MWPETATTLQGANVGEDKDVALKKDIVEITQQHWEQTSRVLLLSTLGHTLTQRGYDLRSDLGHRKLEPFIQIELNDKITTVVSPYDPLVRGVIPSGKQVDLRELFRKPEAVKQRVNFDRRLWVAFSRPIAADRQRLICFEPDIVVDDVPADTPKPGGWYLVPEGLIVPPGAMAVTLRNEQLQRGILKWLEDIRVDVAKAKARPAESPLASGNSVLDILFTILDSKDLERISVPLDIIEKLLRRRPNSHK